ncbi:MAG: dihydroorotate dehydrogenase [Caldilineales bacterium]|nr:dihydroorotate dehydrogenase [Caldilineales bacterium]
MPDLQTLFLNTTFPTPLVLASGIWGTTASLLVRAADAGCGAVTSKSAGPEPRGGHVNPTCLDWGGGLINAIGLPNPGAKHEAEILRETKAGLAPAGVALIASFFADTVENFGHVAATLAQARPDFLEANISCPNVHSDFGEPFAARAASAAAVAESVKQAVPDIPLIVKLAPNVPDIGRIAAAAVEAGADAICAVNTMPGIVIDIESGQPILQNRSGGISGPALLPIALRCVYEIRQALPRTPIIGTGGVTRGEDAVAMLMAGATAVGVGSAIYYRGPAAITLIRNELADWLNQHGFESVESVQNMAHRQPVFLTSPTPAPVPS